MTNKKFSKPQITAEELEKKFDDGEDISEYFKFENFTRRTSVDLPLPIDKSLNEEAIRRGLTKQDLVKMWVIDQLNLIEKKTVKVTTI